MKSAIFSFVFAMFFSTFAHAGFVELGASGTYRKSNVGADIFSEAYSVTASISYLFDEMSAIETSYTEGFARTVMGAVSAGATKEISNHVEMASLDFVYTFGDKEAVLRPYIKAGVGYLLMKEVTEMVVGNNAVTTSQATGFVPSAGIGFRLGVTQNLSLKLGVDGWTSDPIGAKNRSSKIDWAGRAGISWMF